MPRYLLVFTILSLSFSIVRYSRFAIKELHEVEVVNFIYYAMPVLVSHAIRCLVSKT